MECVHTEGCKMKCYTKQVQRERHARLSLSNTSEVCSCVTKWPLCNVLVVDVNYNINHSISVDHHGNLHHFSYNILQDCWCQLILNGVHTYSRILLTLFISEAGVACSIEIEKEEKVTNQKKRKKKAKNKFDFLKILYGCNCILCLYLALIGVLVLICAPPCMTEEP